MKCPWFQFHLRTAVIAMLVCSALLGLAIGAIKWLNTSTQSHIEILNLSGNPLHDVILEWRSPGKSAIRATVCESKLDTGKRIVLPVDKDSAIILWYEIAGKSHSYHAPYVDLWSGETCVYTVNKDGSVAESRKFATK